MEDLTELDEKLANFKETAATKTDEETIERGLRRKRNYIRGESSVRATLMRAINPYRLNSKNKCILFVEK